jgi:hypothetical protein
MLIEQMFRECLCVGPEEDPDSENWGIWHGEFSDAGEVVRSQQILCLPAHDEVVELAKQLGEDLELQVYQLTSGGGEAALIQAPVLDL